MIPVQQPTSIDNILARDSEQQGWTYLETSQPEATEHVERLCVGGRKLLKGTVESGRVR